MSGTSLLLWKNLWFHNQLQKSLPHLYSFSKDENITVADMKALEMPQDHFYPHISMEALLEFNQL
jgi:hypothetical protein